MSAFDIDQRPRARRAQAPQVPSPLDPFLRDFLHWVDGQPDGLVPPRGIRTLAETLDWQPSFAEVLFTAARSRGLLHPVQGRGGRAKVSWRLSARGKSWFDSPSEPA